MWMKPTKKYDTRKIINGCFIKTSKTFSFGHILLDLQRYLDSINLWTLWCLNFEYIKHTIPGLRFILIYICVIKLVMI